MSNAAKLKKRAVELEQKKQFDKALTLYVQFLQESDGTLDDDDVALYNRVGDLMLRVGNVAEALNYYEKAVDLYADRGFHNNAIALCNKVLRQSPGRSSIYYKLGRISATKGFKSDAKKNFLEYADRMQKAGQIDEAFRALKEFADLCPDQDDIRLMLAEQLSKENRPAEALEELQKLHEKLELEGRSAEARATVDRMKSIDPDAVPRVSGSHRPQKSSDLVFLDISYEDKAPSRRMAPPRRQMSDPDLIAVTLRDQPPSVTPMGPMRGDVFAMDEQEDATADPEPIAFIDLNDDAAAQPAAEPSGAETGAPDSAASMAGTFMDTSAALDDPAPLAGATFLGDAAGDLAFDVGSPVDASVAALFDFRSPPRSDEPTPDAPSPFALDPDVSFPPLDGFDTDLPSADEVTSSAGALEADTPTDGAPPADTGRASASAPPDGPRGFDEIVIQPDPALLLEATVTGEDEGSSAGAGMLTWPPTETQVVADEAADGAAAAEDLDALVAEELGTLAAEVAPPQMEAPVAAAPEAGTPNGESRSPTLEAIGPVEGLETFGWEGERAEDGGTGDALPPEEPGPGARDSVATTAESEAVAAVGRQHGAASDGARSPGRALDDLARQIEEAPDDWRLRRRRAELLLELGHRDEGVRELEAIAVELERRSDLEGSLGIIDELIRLAPDSIRRHQKRVELAFRANHRPKLIDAYIDLGDLLFRSGEEAKARAVYHRVLELAPEDPRARAALSALGYGATPPSSASAGATAPPQPPPARDATAGSQAGGARDTGARPAAGGGAELLAGAGHRDAATSAPFVDLGAWLRADDGPKSTRMVTEEKPPTGDEEADFQEMLKKFKQGIAENVDEQDFESHYDLGVAYKEMGLIDEAVAEFQKALRGSEHRVRACEALGQCFVEKEQFQVASSVLTRALAIGAGDDHHLVGVLYLLGRAREALNDHRAALDYYQRVFAVDIEFRDVAERIRTIERKAN